MALPLNRKIRRIRLGSESDQSPTVEQAQYREKGSRAADLGGTFARLIVGKIVVSPAARRQPPQPQSQPQPRAQSLTSLTQIEVDVSDPSKTVEPFPPGQNHANSVDIQVDGIDSTSDLHFDVIV